jgi:uncharacterized protein YecE (DUF72 family)
VTVWIGTSGWQYRHWKPGFYAGVPTSQWLSHYAENFDTVELNGSFYRLPTRERFEAWADALPDGFVMAVKMSRYLTHVRRLRDPAEPVERFVEAAEGLGPHLGPVLIQLPPTLKIDLPSLDLVLGHFPSGVKVAVEPRHPSWWVPELAAVLRSHRSALVEADKRGVLGPRWTTASWRYVRFHEGRARPAPCYGREALDHWAGRLTGTK